MNFLLMFVFIFAIQYAAAFVLGFFIDNPYLIQMITMIILAYFAAYFVLPPGYRKGFYRKQLYHQSACVYLLALMGLQLIMALVF